MALLLGCGGGGGGTSGGPGGPPLVTTATVSGRVRTAAGASLANAPVHLYRTNDHTGQATTTDGEGRYTFSGLQAGAPTQYEIWPLQPGYGFSPTVGTGASIERTDFNGLLRTVIVFPAPQGASLTGADFTAHDGRTGLVQLPRTGQKTGHAAGDDGSLQAGVPWPSPRFVDSGDGTVRDALTGLLWLKDAGRFPPLPWAEALAAAGGLASGTGGLSDGSKAGDWRLPNVMELESLVDASRSQPALPDGHPFQGVAGAYWSSTTYYGDVREAWVIRFTDGRYLNDSLSNVKLTALRSVWPVRSGPPGVLTLPATGQYRTYGTRDDGALRLGRAFPYPRFIDRGDGTVCDTLTGLLWLKQADGIRRPWTEAVAAVRSLASGQHGLTDGSLPGAWRMPNRAELLSLTDCSLGNHSAFFSATFRNAAGAVEQSPIFLNFVTAEFYWTSTTVAGDPAKAWTVYSCDFGCYDIPKSASGYTLAVR